MALSSSVPLPFTCPKVKIGSSSSSNYCLLGNWWGASLFNRRALGTATTTTAIEAQESSSPWLMLPPKFGSYYKFYKLADNKVDTLLSPSDAIRELPITCCRGSTHGWLALLGNDTCILYNPISRRHIKLPSILNLPRMPNQDEENTDFSDITKMILTCSPDEDEENCRALIINNWANALAFCWPGRSKEWTLMLDENNNREANIFYDDCVYSPRLKLFFALTNRRKIETWDFGEPASSPPKLIKVDKCYFDTSLETSPFQSLCDYNDYLVFAGEDILYVIQYAMTPVGPDGSYLPETVSGFPHVTVRFDILKYDRKKGKFKYVDGSSSSCLGGYAIFVGALSHSVAIPATRFPELKPDSIYFTDGYFLGSFDGYDDDYHFDDELVRGHDIGIYNYQDKTVSPCYYPCDVPSLKTIMPPPTWFFPN